MTINSNTIFLAGATGLVGSGIIKHILSNYPSMRIKATYHLMKPFIENKQIQYVQADFTDKKQCRQAVHGCDYAILAAGSTGGAGYSQLEPHLQLTDNMVIDSFLLEAMHFEGVKRVIYMSSATVYQEFDGYIMEEELDWNQDPHSSYIGVGWAKRSAEKLCQFWHEKYGIEIVVVRCANVYGPFAKFDPKTSNFIPALIKKAVDKVDPFEVWGSPDASRDVILAADFARAILLLLEHNEIKFGIFNLGYGETISVREVVSLALKYADHRPSNVVYSKEKPKAIPIRALNCNKIKNAINWKPVYPIEKGISETTRWWIENKDWWSK